MVTVLLFCVAPLAGWWAGQSVDRTLQGVVRAQRSSRTLVTADVVTGDGTSATPVSSGSSSAASAQDTRQGDTLRWTAPDGSPHTRKVTADLEVWQGEGLRLWTDQHGRLVPAPLDSATATTHAVLAGIAVGAAACGTVLIGRSLLMWRLMRRRMDLWEREWARVGQDWGHAGAGG